VEYGEASMQYPPAQSASDRHGEQKLPSPTHAPARGMQVRTSWQLCPAVHPASLAHSGVQCLLSQCWKIPPASGQSSSVEQAFPAPGVHMLHCATQAASRGQLDCVAQTGAHKFVPWLSGRQCVRVGFTICGGAQSRSEAHGEQYVRGRHTVRVAPSASLSLSTFGVWFTVEHHQPWVQSASLPQPNLVQNAFASVVVVP
jgi:hypothetical protein